MTYQKTRSTVLHILVALKFFVRVCNILTVPVEVVSFGMVKTDIFCKYELITV